MSKIALWSGPLANNCPKFWPKDRLLLNFHAYRVVRGVVPADRQKNHISSCIGVGFPEETGEMDATEANRYVLEAAKSTTLSDVFHCVLDATTPEGEPRYPAWVSKVLARHIVIRSGQRVNVEIRPPP